MQKFDKDPGNDFDSDPAGAPEPNQRRVGLVMIMLAFAVALGLLTVLFDGLLGRRDDPNRNLRYSDAGGVSEVVLYGDRRGQYSAPGTINGEPVRFLLDTGATDVSVPGALAARLGLRRGRPGRAYTANGTVIVYDTRLDEVALGPIVLDNVRAHINPAMGGDIVLLGMSFMRHLELNQKGGVLTLRQSPG